MGRENIRGTGHPQRISMYAFVGSSGSGLDAGRRSKQCRARKDSQRLGDCSRPIRKCSHEASGLSELPDFVITLAVLAQFVSSPAPAPSIREARYPEVSRSCSLR